jgi:demethylspheroidene O-methyltransferase
MATHHAMLYEDLRDPLALLRGDAGETELSRYWAYATAPDASALEPDAVARYSELMAASQPMVAEQVLAAYPLRRHRRLLDVGGGTGAFLRAVAGAVPDLELGLFDLPAVVSQVRDDAGGRIQVTGGDFTKDPLPSGFDAISLVRIIHDHDDDVVLKILANVRRALPENGVLIIAEPLAATPGAEAVGDAYFGFYLLAMGSGRPRTVEAINTLLRRSGFGPARRYRTPVPLVASVLAASVNS